MFSRTASAVASTSIAHDILTEKQNEVAQLARQASEAVDLVTRTINDLEGINQQIDGALSEIDTYTKELAATRAAMSKQRSNNTAIISNFAKLLDVGESAEATGRGEGHDCCF